MLAYISLGMGYFGSIFYICQLRRLLAQLFVTIRKYIKIIDVRLAGQFGTGYAFNIINYEQLRIPQSPLNQSS